MKFIYVLTFIVLSFAQQTDSLELNYTNGRLQSVTAHDSDPTGYQKTGGLTSFYDYDSNGNVIRDGGHNVDSMSYNHFNLPDRVVMVDGTRIMYSYNGAGQRIQKIGISATGDTLYHNRYIRDLDGKIQAEINHAGQIVYRMIYAGEKLLGQTEYIYVDGKLDHTEDRYFLTDHLSNVRAVLADQRLFWQDDFENGVDNYPYLYNTNPAEFSMPAAEIITEPGKANNTVLRLNTEAAGFVMKSKLIDIEPGTAYRLRFRIKLGQVGTSHAGIVSYQRTPSGYINGTWLWTHADKTDTTWQEVESTIVTHSTANQILIRFGLVDLNGTVGQASTAMFDDFEWYELTNQAVLNDEMSQNLNWTTSTSNENMHARAHEIGVEPGNEANTVRFIRVQKGSATAQQIVTVKPLTRYRLTYRLNISERGDAATQEWIQFLDHNQQPGDIHNVVTVIDNDVRGWQTKTLEFSTPAQGESIGNGRQFSGNTLRIGFELTGQTATAGEVWLDDIQLTEVTDKRHRVISAQDYYPYGLTIPGRSFNIGSLGESKFKYQSKERDQETGYDYFEARFYDPAIGRFLQVDPLADIRKHDFYSSYVAMYNNPLRIIDPTGMEGEETDKNKKKKFTDITYKDKNGKDKTVKIYFTKTTSDQKSSDNKVDSKLVDAVESAVKEAVKTTDITSLTITATTNGTHGTESKHYEKNGAKAVDIGAVNGKAINGSTDTIKALQEAFEKSKNRRENFGPSMMKKSGKEYINDKLKKSTKEAREKVKKNHNNHIHWSID